MFTSARDWWLAITFAATTVLSAFLLFQIQPLLGKHILPWFGGSPAVWTTCLLFFQTVLFAGYLYAHLSERWLRSWPQALLHVGLLVAAIALLRILPDPSWEPHDSYHPAARILLILTVSIGLPYFVLAATAPLVQVWFARSFPNRAPYRLYALSNLGSLLALLSYPLLFERMFDLPQQAGLWSAGFVSFAALCAYAAARSWHCIQPTDGEAMLGEPVPLPNGTQRALWLGLPACAAVTLLATTNHVCTDVAVMPLLWVVPLALYLITFIIAFDHPRWYRPTLIALLTLAAIYGTALVQRHGLGWIELYQCGTTGQCIHLACDAYTYWTTGGNSSPPESPQFHIGVLPFLFLNFAALFGICLLCHGELARRRPHPRFLTSYYLMIAAGGALGAVAVTLLAPLVFQTFVEWHLGMLVAGIAALALILRAPVNRDVGRDAETAPSRVAWLPTLALVLLLVPVAFVLLDLVEYLHAPMRGIRWQQRNFFGTLTIREHHPDQPEIRNFVLLHGTTVHGSQFTAPDRRGEPTTYYSTSSGVGRTLNFFQHNQKVGGLRVGAVGLGTGTLAAYAGEGDSICFYEIDPAVVDIATSGRWFTYLADCQARGARCEIKLGDARLTLQGERQQRQPPRYHVLVLDAFSGDAVPTHLLTAEAFEIYLAHLSTAGEPASTAADGAIAVHVSNRYVDLERVVRGAAEHFGLRAVRIHSPRNASQSLNSAEWIVLTRNESLLQDLASHARPPATPENLAILWTDAHSNLFDVLK